MKNNFNSTAARNSSVAAATSDGTNGSLRNSTDRKTDAGSMTGEGSFSVVTAIDLGSKNLSKHDANLTNHANGNTGAGGQHSRMVSAMKGREYLRKNQSIKIRNSGGSTAGGTGRRSNLPKRGASLSNSEGENTGSAGRRSTVVSAMKDRECTPRKQGISLRNSGGSNAAVAGKRSSIVSAMADNKNLAKQESNLRNTAGEGTGAGVDRPSSVVKYVERLKERREKLHAHHLEMKEKKNARVKQDADNPHWEIANMIHKYQNKMALVEQVSNQVTVCVRKRPLSGKELTRKDIDIISVRHNDLLIVHEPRRKIDLTKCLKHHKFRVDYAFDEYSDNAMVYRYAVKPLVKTIFDGGMATCFAYGQTGSGKTHTMGGEFDGHSNDCETGIYAMAVNDIFDLLNNPTYSSLNITVSASFFEICKEQVFDLLSEKSKLRVHQDNKKQVQIIGLTEKLVNSVEEVLKLIKYGNSARTSGETCSNANSSQSHTVFQILLYRKDSRKSRILGKLSFIDLAGTTMPNNQSLLALKECIRALGRQSSHLPFRVSKLIQVLRDSFIGEKSKTCIIAMVSPGLSSCEHTLNTLRYADRVKELAVSDSLNFYRKEKEIVREDEEDINDDDDDDDGIAITLKENGMDNLALLPSLCIRKAHSEPILDYGDDSELIPNQLYLVIISKMIEFVYQDPNNRKPIWEWNFKRCQLEQEVSDGPLLFVQLTQELSSYHIKIMYDFLDHFLNDGLKLYEETKFINEEYCTKGESMFSQLGDIIQICIELLDEYKEILNRST